MRAHEFLTETINPDILDPRFSHSQKIGDYTYTAEFGYGGYLYVSCFRRGKEIGRAHFHINGDNLESTMSDVDRAYQRRGIASTMYAYAKMLGNDVKVSNNLLPDGRKMWKAFRKSGANKHLVAEESYQPPELEVGDEVRFGKFKNRKAEIKGFKKDKHNQPVLKTNKGDVQLFKPRVAKLMKESEFRPTNLKLSNYRGPYHPETMRPYGPEFKEGLALAEIVDDLIDNGVKPKMVSVSPRRLLATQEWLSDFGSDDPSFPEYSDRPVVLDHNGEMYILDGHHRCSAALKNNKMIQVYLFDIMDDSEMLDEVNMDNEKGIGATPNNREIDYFGLRVKMAPLTFLRMAHELTIDADTEQRVLSMAKYIKDGGPVGSPMLIIEIPGAWEDGDLSEDAKISGHEGRHRMEAIIKAEGNAPVEVHLLFPGLRRRHITPEMIDSMNHSIYTERGQFIIGPWFKHE
jgi:hypothetical protein